MFWMLKFQTEPQKVSNIYIDIYINIDNVYNKTNILK